MSQKFHLHYSSELQGKFSLKELNFLFVFQVNCPGCFLYGMPTFNQLHLEFGSQVGFLGLSTAFEDFEFNSEANTAKLLEEGLLVGETNKALQTTTYPGQIDFPVAMDQMANDHFDLERAAITLCSLNPDYTSWPISDQKALKERVLIYLKQQEKLSLTFTLNQLRGTPSFLLFDQRYQILDHFFGHQPVELLRSRIQMHFK